MKKIAVVLSGCGYLDGSEIYEATFTLLALDEAEAMVQCFAPDILQMHVINHLNGDVMPEQRNVLVEAARLTRGAISPLSQAGAAQFDGLIIPGGYGAAKNLSNFATAGSAMQLQPNVLAFAQAMHQAGKPIGLVCIAPAMAPRIADAGVRYTIGNDPQTAAAIDAMGGKHVDCAVTDCVIDHERKIVSTPAYMYPARLSEARAGIQKLVQAVLKMA